MATEKWAKLRDTNKFWDWIDVFYAMGLDMQAIRALALLHQQGPAQRGCSHYSLTVSHPTTGYNS